MLRLKIVYGLLIGVVGVKPLQRRDLSLVALSPGPIRRAILFVQNVDELSRVKYLAARLALNKLDVFFAGNDADLWVFAH